MCKLFLRPLQSIQYNTSKKATLYIRIVRSVQLYLNPFCPHDHCPALHLKSRTTVSFKHTDAGKQKTKFLTEFLKRQFFRHLIIRERERALVYWPEIACEKYRLS